MDIITECFSFLSIHWHCCDKLFKIFNSSSRITSKFVASRFVFFCSVNHFSGGGVNASHNAIRLPSLACKNKTENGEGNRHGDWNFCQKKEEDIALFLQVTRIRTIRKKLIDYSPKQDDHKQWTFKHRNKPNRSKSTNHKSRPLELIQVNMCFLRGPLRWLTEQKDPNFLRSLQNAVQSNTTNLAVIIICKKHSVVRGWK